MLQKPQVSKIANHENEMDRALAINRNTLYFSWSSCFKEFSPNSGENAVELPKRGHQFPPEAFGPEIGKMLSPRVCIIFHGHQGRMTPRVMSRIQISMQYSQSRSRHCSAT